MESSEIRSTGSDLAADEDAAASHAWELIGGMVGGAAEPTEEPAEKEVWSLEEGDDSVFYSDEEQPRPDAAGAALARPGADVCQRVTNSVADDDDEPEEAFPRRSPSDFEGDTTQLLICPKDIEQKLEAAKNEEPIVFGEESPESDVTAEKLEGSCGEMLPTNSQVADAETPLWKNTAVDEVNQVKEEEVAHKAQTTDQDSAHVFRKQSQRDLPAHSRLHPSLGSGYSTLPLMKKPDLSGGHQETFNHLSSSSKYSTVSYRKIRRGNTRQRIAEFEHFMQNQ